MTKEELIKRLETTCFGLDPIDPLRLLVDDVIEALAQPEQKPTYGSEEVRKLREVIASQAKIIEDHIPDARKMVTEQEPVAHCEAGPEYCPVCNTELNQEPAIYPEEAYEMGLEEIAFYTAPPQRTWVGLTGDDWKQITRKANYHWEMTTSEYAERIGELTEAKLKEKNT